MADPCIMKILETTGKCGAHAKEKNEQQSIPYCFYILRACQSFVTENQILKHYIIYELLNTDDAILSNLLSIDKFKYAYD